MHDIAKTILVVDDENDVIQAIRGALQDRWHIITTTSPHQALSILKEPTHIDLLITDLFMPEMDGAKLLTESRRIRPGLRAVLLTGLASDEEYRKWRRRGETVIWKPWLEEDFVRIVARNLAN